MSGNEGAAAEARALEIRGSTKMRLLGRFLACLCKVLGWTMRIRMVDTRGEPAVIDDRERPCIVAMWHNTALIEIMSARVFGATRKGVVLTSASKDGAALAAFAGAFGLGSVRGSSSRRGRAALVALLRALKAGQDVAITPDGPRGPRYVLQPGVVKLAQLARVPVVIVHAHCSREWRLKTWDRFRIPLPFSKITLVMEEALDVPHRMTDAEEEAMRVDLENRMRKRANDGKGAQSDEH